MLEACLEMLSDSKSAAKYKCKRTKTTHVLTSAVAKDNNEQCRI